jgi:signal transduction histidine kinase
MEASLKQSHDKLEQRVKERTHELRQKQRELERLNKELNDEIDKRKAFEADLKDKGEQILIAYRHRDFLSKRLVDLLERERHDIGNTLHDQIGQILTGVNIELEGLKKEHAMELSDLSDSVEYIQHLLRSSIAETRKISQHLRSDVLNRFGLLASVKQLIEEIKKQTRLKINLFVKHLPEDFRQGDVPLTVYRLIQESLTNIVKHASAREVYINITQKKELLSLTIEDDGRGFDYGLTSGETDLSNENLGITIMRERVSLLGGEFRIESRPGEGTLILADIPLAL